MTDSVSNPGREDVLTQVRKLVSAVPPDTSSAANAGRLLLTPAQRVTDPSGPTHLNPPKSRRLSLEDRIAELEAAVGSQSQEWEPDGSEDLEPHRPSAVIYTPSMTSDQPNLAAPSGLRLADDIAEETHQRPEEDAASAESTGVFEHNADPDLDETETATDADSDGFALTEAVAFRAAKRPLSEPEVPEAAHVHVEDDADFDDHADLSAEPADFLFAHRGRPEPSSDESDTSNLPVEDAAVPQPPEVAPAADEDGQDHADVDPAPVADLAGMGDERLKAIVREVLLEELTGPLGEKMTRNIRKMLRREIDRAISLREFD
jgi:hypothetical protein